VTTRLLCALLLCLSTFSRGTPAQTEVPATPAGRVLSAWLDAFNSGSVEKVREFDQTYRTQGGPPMPPPEGTVRFRAQTGGFSILRIEKNEPTSIAALLQERDLDAIGRIELSVTADDPPKIAAFAVRPTPRPPDLALPRLTEAQALAALSARIDELVAADRFSGVVLVARDGKALLEKKGGKANRETGAPITANTRFRIGSMNKMFTAVATLRLAGMRKLSLDDSVQKYLPGTLTRDDATKVTIRHLLTHTAGTGDIFGPDFEKNRLTLREHGDYLKLYAERPLLHPPGAEWRYSNFGYVLLGAIIERVTGTTYYNAVRREVFDPAGMTATGSEPESETVENRSAGYMRRNDAWTPNVDTLPWRGTAAGGGYSTARDLLRFAQALDSGKLISKEMLTQATTPLKEHYGYGFGIQGEGPLRSYGHGGGAPGMNGDLRIYPALGVVLVGLSNPRSAVGFTAGGVLRPAHDHKRI